VALPSRCLHHRKAVVEVKRAYDPSSPEPEHRALTGLESGRPSVDDAAVGVQDRWIGPTTERTTYRGLGPHPADPRAPGAAAELVALIGREIPGTVVEHVGSTAVPALAGKNVLDLQITAEPPDVPRLTDALLALGFERQHGRDPFPPERPMLEATFGYDGAVFFVHRHVVPTEDPDVEQMIAFRDLLRRDRSAREAYEREKTRIAAGTDDSLDYTRAKSDLIRRLLG
jgi:GrpB-like predicted nucleotidyltransferase (UPF0157 family)